MADYYYLTSRNEVIDLHSKNIWSDEHWVYGYAYESEISNGFINNLTVPSVEKEVDVWFRSDSAYQTAQVRNNFYNMIDRDVKNQTPGRLYVGSYYLECYIVGIQNPEASISHCKIHSTVSIVSGSCKWICEHELPAFIKVEASSQSNTGLDYPYDYPYDYSASMLIPSNLTNSFANASEFKIVIDGPATNPSVIIAGHTYRMNCTLVSGETITIDSRNKTIVKHNNADGYDQNYFGYRYKPESIFEPIPSGIVSLVWSGGFSWALTLYDERREPLFIESAPEEEVDDGTVAPSSSYFLTDEIGRVITDSLNRYILVEV